MKQKLFLLFVPFLLVSCTPAEANIDSNNSQDNNSNSNNNVQRETFSQVKRRLLDGVTPNNLNEINEEAIEQGVYKPMFKFEDYSVTRVIYPFKRSKITSTALDINNVIVLDKYITATDYDSLLNQNFNNKEDAKNYLSQLGYSFKSTINLPISGLEKADLWGSPYLDYVLKRGLYKETGEGNLANDLAVSLEKVEASDNTYVLTIRDDVYYKDRDGNNAGKITATHFIPKNIQSYRNKRITGFSQISDTEIKIQTKDINSVESLKKEIAFLFNYPNCISQNSLTITEIDNGYTLEVNDYIVNYLFDDGNTDFDLFRANKDGISEDYYIKDNFYFYSTTYGFFLNPTGGNDAYVAALDNQYFRNALLSILDYDHIAALSYSSALFQQSNQNKSYKISPAFNSNDGIEKAKEQFALAKNNGLDSQIIEIFIHKINANNPLQKAKQDYLCEVIEEVFGDSVKIKEIEFPWDTDYYSRVTYYPSYYLSGDLEFYCQVALDGMDFLTSEDYIKEVLSQ